MKLLNDPKSFKSDSQELIILAKELEVCDEDGWTYSVEGEDGAYCIAVHDEDGLLLGYL